MSKKISLYDIADEVSALGEMICNQDAGEITEDHDELERSITALLEAKTDSCVHFIQKMKDDISLADDHIKRLGQFKKSRKNAIASFSNYAGICMQKLGVKKLLGVMGEVTKRKPTEVVEITDEKKVPTEFITVETIIKIDKVALKKALKNGEVEQTDGLRLTEGKESIQFKMKSVK